MAITWQATVLTLFPEMFPGPLGISLSGRALQDGLWRLSTLNIRDSACDKHRSVDDTPAGGGAGMVMRADVAAAAIDATASSAPALARIYLSPRGAPLTQARVRDLARGKGVILFCGRFEGLDQRVIDARQLEEISIGDYVLSGGEIAADGLDRRLRAPLARRHRSRSIAERRKLRKQPPGISAIYETAFVGRARNPGRSFIRRSRTHRTLAAGAGGNIDAGSPSRFMRQKNRRY